jgi:beta-lactam-binding protein with PASTA domain
VLQPRQTPRVVGQSIKPGTKVTVGTVVDLVLAPASVIPFSIFDNIHADLAQRNVGDLLDGMLADPATRQSVLKYDKAENVPAAERTALTERFQAADVRINDATPATSFAAAFNAARGALAFK